MTVSDLIKRAVDNLRGKLIAQFIVYRAGVSGFSVSPAFGTGGHRLWCRCVLTAFIVMHYQGVNANIMSMGGIAVAIGAMVDVAVVMIENAHKHIEASPASLKHLEGDRAMIGYLRTLPPPIGGVLCLLIITLSFIPVTLAQEGLFLRLAFTKTAGGCRRGLAVTLIPVLMGYLIRGKIPDGEQNPVESSADCPLSPGIGQGAGVPKVTLVVAVAILVATIYRQRKSAANSYRLSTRRSSVHTCHCPACHRQSVQKSCNRPTNPSR